MTNIVIDSPITGKRETLTQAQFNSYMAQTNGAVLKWIVEPVLKHGSHDQKTHGSWATGSDGLTVSIDNSKFEKTMTLNNKKGEPLAYVQFQDFEIDKKIDILYLHSYDSGKGYATRVIDELYKAMPDKEIYWGKTSAPESTHLAQKFSDKYGRTQFMPWGEGVIDGYEWGELYGDKTAKVEKHGSHDQKTHGSWANGSGSSGLTHREIYNLQVGRGDSLVSKVYKAEDTFQPQLQRELPIPFPPKPRVEFATKEEYDKAYKEYSKNYDEWTKESHRNIKSDLGQKHLDGTRAGVQKYMDNVLDQDWFKSEFGTGGVVPKPQVKLLDINSAGRYVFGFKNGQPYTSMIFNKGFSKAEPTILHEIAHYATTISQREPFDGHGVEFAKNHVYITSKAIGSDYADGLAQAYREEGVDVG